jgi:enolase-phosphatase E1
MAQDLKIPYLKSLQGYLWLRGYESGEIRCPLFPDVHPCLLRWHAAGLPIVIYSSGSVPAQKLLFQYTNSTPDPDLRPLIGDYFDTVNAGPKTEKESYEKIARTRDEERGRWLFLSDNVKEVKAAREAGMQSFVVVREGNAVLTEEDRKGNVLVENFEEIRIEGL